MNKTSRRSFLKTTGAAALGPLLTQGAEKERPNIIFIMADDLGYGDLGCYGQKLIQTPRIDRMAREGIRFTHCYAGSPVCAPARNALMTGQHTGHTRIRGNSPLVGGTVEAFGEGQRRVSLEAEDVTVAQLLKHAGYATGITGKWGLAEPDTAGVPNQKGFDEWLGYLNQNHAAYYFTTYLWKNRQKLVLEGNQDGRKRQYTHDLFTDFALDFVQRERNGPFFLYLAYTIPHDKLEVPKIEPYVDQAWPGRAKVYASMITRMDRDVGRLLDCVKKLDLDSSTIVFFCSDNGAPDRPWGDLFRSRGQLRGKKGELYEGGIRVPMIVRWPSQIPRGRTSEAVWYFPDFLPTACALAGVDSPKSDGIDISTVLHGTAEALPDRFLYWEFHNDGLQQAVRWKNWKAVRPRKDRQLELYDLPEDLSEQRNLAGERPDVVSRITAFLKTARTGSRYWPA
jgi:arylsulfatase A-like enzyme